MTIITVASQSVILTMVLASLVVAGCAHVEKVPVYDLRPGMRIEVVNLGEMVNTAGDDYAPSLDPDAASLYFSSHRDGEYGLYRVDLGPSDRMPLQQEPVRIFKSGIRDGNISFSANGERIVFVSCDNRGLGDCDIYEVIDFGSDAPIMKNLEEINTLSWESCPALSTDGRTLYFAGLVPRGLSMADQTDADILVSRQGDDGFWSLPIAINRPVNTGDDDNTPYLAPGDSVLFFSSTRPGGYGGYDIYVSFMQRDGTWGTVYNLGSPINSGANERSITMTQDGSTIFFTSDRQGEGGFGKFDIYTVRSVP